MLAKFRPPSGYAPSAAAAREAQAEAKSKERELGELESSPFLFAQNDRIENMLRRIKLGDWDSTADFALTIINDTREDGRNLAFDALMRYYNSNDEHLKWSTIQLVETVIYLSPRFMRRELMVYLSRSEDFSLRASAASICIELANFAPELVPLDLLLVLSHYSEDWYVEAPANAALKTMLGTMPMIYRVLHGRLEGVMNLRQV